MLERAIRPPNRERLDLCVCVPARNEAESLPILLSALAAQTWPHAIALSIVVNNSDDDSLAVIENARVRTMGRLSIHVEDVKFPLELAHAGSARRRAMDNGLALLPEQARGVLVSTDADTRPPPEWLEHIARAITGGADLVGGRIALEDAEPLPHNVVALRAAWDRYWQVVRTIEDDLDPLPWDPAPRHGDHTGASLAIRAELYGACGGVPVLPTGEDRALVAAALAQGGRLTHPADVFTYVSPRRDGRAERGMAQAMQDLFDLAATGAPPRAPGFEHWCERALWRRSLRERPDGHALIARAEPLLAPMPHDMILEIAR
ncbi:family 2 glycosyl transferase [Novosphingobium sp. Rr 2-17]|uniref:glycosyltransferase n=1 Tax=Novosphingobium sp. Rr 2-17 TaxID=555793 RepID=UPI0002699500|nr:glycosyltransferase [Novosphingobium sp. Rr 2-17]EIZ79853.1 family 2 glycosyl transferase [Novosphingobium sp. Rr 2-17]